MSYRIYFKLKIGDAEKEYQAFGNNECPKDVIKEFKKQGAKINPECCCDYFEITNLDKVIKATEAYMKDEYKTRLERSNHSIADFSKDFEDGCDDNLTSYMLDLIDYAYIFTSANILKFIGEDNYTVDYTKTGIKYKLREGVQLFAKGH